jgi:hypothetical protein
LGFACRSTQPKSLFGFTGILLALPVAAVIMVVLRHANDFYKQSDIYDDGQVVETVEVVEVVPAPPSPQADA